MRAYLLGSALALSALALGCGSSDSGASSSTGMTGTASSAMPASAAFQAQVASAFSAPGTPIGAIPSTLAGVSTWTFSTSAQGTVAVGTDATGQPKAELALLTDASGAIQGAAYAIASDLAVTGAALAQAVNADLMTAQAHASTQSLRLQDLVGGGDGGLTSSSGTALVVNCATSLVEGFGAGTIALLGLLVGGAVAALTCPETIGAGCLAGGAIAVGGIAVASSASQNIGPSCSQ